MKRGHITTKDHADKYQIFEAMLGHIIRNEDEKWEEDGRKVNSENYLRVI